MEKVVLTIYITLFLITSLCVGAIIFKKIYWGTTHIKNLGTDCAKVKL